MQIEDCKLEKYNTTDSKTIIRIIYIQLGKDYDALAYYIVREFPSLVEQLKKCKRPRELKS